MTERLDDLSFPAAVSIIRAHLFGARGDVSERRLNAALMRVLPSLTDVADGIRLADQEARWIRRRTSEV